MLWNSISGLVRHQHNELNRKATMYFLKQIISISASDVVVVASWRSNLHIDMS